MDVGVWLLQMGAAPESIRWIVPRDSWVRNRDKVQPGEAFFKQTAGSQANQLESAAEATCIPDLFERLERTGEILRIDTTVTPTMYRGATISCLELEALRSIKDVVRKGRVLRIEHQTVILEHGQSKAAQAASMWIALQRHLTLDLLYVCSTVTGSRFKCCAPALSA